MGLGDLPAIGDRADLGDGLTPAQRGEATLTLFLGPLYAQLEHEGFVDIPSLRFAEQERVHRLRRDPRKQHERRVRVFEHGRYLHDYYIVRAQDAPEADHLLTVFLRLCSDETGILSVVHAYKVFTPHSDDYGVPPARRSTSGVGGRDGAGVPTLPRQTCLCEGNGSG